MEQYDVVVVGAGLAGLQCTRLLSREGLRVLLVDRKATLTDQVHTTGIFVRRTLEDFDIPEAFLGPPVRHVTLSSPARRSITLESDRDEFRAGRMGPLYHHYLEECERAGATWAPGTRYVGSEPGDGGSLVHLATRGRARRVRARFIVGADGAVSTVARDLGLDQNREWIVGVEDVLEGVPLDGPPRFHCFLDPVLAPGYLAWVVHDGEEVHLGVGGYASRFRPLHALSAFRESVAGLVDLSRARLKERRGGRIPVGGVLRRLVHERGLIVGDAAGAPSPLTAGGLDPCMRLSRLAAQVIAAYLAAGDPSVLAAYTGHRFRSRFISRLWMRRLLETLNRPGLLEMAVGALRVPPLHHVARHVFFGRGSFPDVDLSGSLQSAMSASAGAAPTFRKR